MDYDILTPQVIISGWVCALYKCINQTHTRMHVQSPCVDFVRILTQHWRRRARRQWVWSLGVRKHPFEQIETQAGNRRSTHPSKQHPPAVLHARHCSTVMIILWFHYTLWWSHRHIRRPEAFFPPSLNFFFFFAHFWIFVLDFQQGLAGDCCDV